MKVSGASGVGSAGGPGRTRPTSGGFQLPPAASAAGAASVARASSVAGVMSVDALLALQDVGGPTERKRRAVRRAGRILDILDEVKVDMLSGQVTSGHLDKLMVAVREQRDGVEDEKLEGILNEIETRAAVEMAKLERARRAS